MWLRKDRMPNANLQLVGGEHTRIPHISSLHVRIDSSPTLAVELQNLLSESATFPSQTLWPSRGFSLQRWCGALGITCHRVDEAANCCNKTQDVAFSL